MDLFSQFTELSRPTIEQKEWMKNHIMERVTNDSLERVIDECIQSGKYAIDLESQGLDNRSFPSESGRPRTEHQIVGVCLSPNGKVGYYIPMRHKEPEMNCSVTLVEKGLRRLFDSPSVGIYHNAKFDQEFLQFCGTSKPLSDFDDVRKWEDTLILAYLDDNRRKNKGLKALSKKILGYEMIELESLFDPSVTKQKGLDYSTLDPAWEPVIWYAASDAICTYLLHEHFHPRIHKPASKEGGSQKTPRGDTQKTIYLLEKMCVPATRWMERSRVPTDPNVVSELIRIGYDEWLEALHEVFNEVSKQLGRDIRPAHYKMIFGEESSYKEYKFDPKQLLPSHTDRLKEAENVAAKQGLDPMEIGSNGKRQVKTILKEVKKVTNPKEKEKISFPVVYDINKPQQLGLMFRELNIPGLNVTEKSGQIQTSADEIDRVVDEAGANFSFMKAVKKFRSVQKALASNLLPIYTDADPRDNTLKIDFHGSRVETGRFSTKGRNKNKPLQGGTTFNLHSTPSTYDPNRPKCLGRIRECFVAREGRVLAAIDYSGVELRIVTNLSREPKWMTEFFRCSSCEKTFDRGDGKSTPEPPPPRCPNCGSDKIGDLHTLTALSIYGEDAREKANWKKLRGNGKATNFALCYGGGGNAVINATGCDKTEGWRVKNKFDGTYKVLAKWWGVTKRFAQKYKYVKTAFGRWYRVPDIDHENRFFKSKAERNSINAPIQGTSADIMKFAMALIYKECKKRDWLDKVGMNITIHDELVFDIDLDIVEEAIDIIVHLMTVETVKRLKWPVPLTTDVELGFNWTVPWDLNEMRYGEVRFKGNKKIKSPSKLENPEEWDSLPSWPEFLRPHFKAAQTGPIKTGSIDIPKAEPEKSPEEIQKEAREIKIALNEVKVPTVEEGESLTYTVRQKNLSLGLVESLAQLIQECNGGGLTLLKVQVHETKELIIGPEDKIYVSPAQWAILSRHYGL